MTAHLERSDSPTKQLLEVTDLMTEFPVYRGRVMAVAGVSFHVSHNEVVGLIGETGCGKSVAALSVMRLVRSPGRIVNGRISFDGIDVLSLSERAMRQIRGRGMSMIFQRPMSSLDPVFTLGQQFRDLIRLHRRVTKQSAHCIAISSLEEVALPDPEGVLRRYPHELSGGMQQRAMIAMALACESKLLLADEPTTAVDVSVQLQILKLIQEIMHKRSMSVILISHDMGVIGSMCNRVYVMYAGKIVEYGPVKDIIQSPSHPYVISLIDAIPAFEGSERRLRHIPGEVCDPLSPPPGCRFHPRCPSVTAQCAEVVPEMATLGEDRGAACHLLRDSPNPRPRRQ